MKNCKLSSIGIAKGNSIKECQQRELLIFEINGSFGTSFGSLSFEVLIFQTGVSLE